MEKEVLLFKVSDKGRMGVVRSKDSTSTEIFGSTVIEEKAAEANAGWSSGRPDRDVADDVLENGVEERVAEEEGGILNVAISRREREVAGKLRLSDGSKWLER